MVTYNTSLLDNSTNLYEIATEINTLSGNILASVLLLTIGIVLLIMFRYSNDFKRVMAGVAFIEVILSLIFWGVGFISLNILIIPILFFMVTIFINIWGG